MSADIDLIELLEADASMAGVYPPGVVLALTLEPSHVASTAGLASFLVPMAGVDADEVEHRLLGTPIELLTSKRVVRYEPGRRESDRWILDVEPSEELDRRLIDLCWEKIADWREAHAHSAFVTSFDASPEVASGPDRSLYLSLFGERLWPVDELAPGDTLLWYSSEREAVTLASRLLAADRFDYADREQAASHVEGTFGRDVRDGWVLASAPERGYGLAFTIDQAREVTVPKPEKFRFPLQGWMRFEDAEIIWPGIGSALEEGGEGIETEPRATAAPRDEAPPVETVSEPDVPADEVAAQPDAESPPADEEPPGAVAEVPELSDEKAEDRDVDSLPMDEAMALRDSCTRYMNGHGPRDPAGVLAEIGGLPDSDLAADTYGRGGTVELLEEEVRGLLGKPAAVFMPSGIMAQQIALRIHADSRNRPLVVFHPACHLELHEDMAYRWLHGLRGLPLGNGRELLTLADLESVREPIGALVLELPQREIGGRLPTWHDLEAQISWARERGAAVHLDGARLWETGPFYQRSLGEIAGLFDSVYVSFYKGLGGVAGSLLLGEEDVIDEARVWRHRHGGTVFGLWPYAASALAGLRSRLPRMGEYVDHARAIATALSVIDGVDVVPDPPQTPMMHVHLRTTASAVVAGVRRLADEEGLWTWSGSQPTDTPAIRRVELAVGDATLTLSPEQVASAVTALLPG